MYTEDRNTITPDGPDHGESFSQRSNPGGVTRGAQLLFSFAFLQGGGAWAKLAGAAVGCAAGGGWLRR